MAKLFNLKDFVLLSAGVAVDTLGEFKSVAGIFPYLQKFRYGDFPSSYKKQSYDSSVSRLVKSGKIERLIDDKKRVFLRLTPDGDKEIRNRFPLFFRDKWDGKFMIVVFDVPEKERVARDMLRVKLKEMGFGKLQESVWISPYHFEDELKAFLQSAGYLDFVFVMRASRVLGKKLSEISSKIWKLEEIGSQYKNILEKCNSLPKRVNKRELKQIWDAYFRVISIDPLLPKELLPEDWLQEKVKNSLDNKLTTVNK